MGTPGFRLSRSHRRPLVRVPVARDGPRESVDGIEPSDRLRMRDENPECRGGGRCRNEVFERFYEEQLVSRFNQSPKGQAGETTKPAP